MDETLKRILNKDRTIPVERTNRWGASQKDPHGSFVRVDNEAVAEAFRLRK